ncbi:MAG: hypothetical protein ACR2LI_03080, partial [Propionibacteriaceae bacterium]
MQTVYEAAGGDVGLLRLAAAWHARVLDDEIVSHAFSHGFHPDHTRRLAAYWAEAVGGPPTFTTEMGDETSVVRIHSGNGPHHEMDQRAIACFDQALADVGLDKSPAGPVRHDDFAWSTTTVLARRRRVPGLERRGQPAGGGRRTAQPGRCRRPDALLRGIGRGCPAGGRRPASRSGRAAP